MSSAKHLLFRESGDDGDRDAVTYIELFFDLVFVFAVTQLSHRLLVHLTPVGAIETLILLCAVWWAWVYTSWATNWLNPDRGQVRIMLLALMLACLALSSALPDAFGASGLVFAGAYLSIQIGRTAYLAWAFHGVRPSGARNFVRITSYFVASTPLWLWGAISAPDTRLILWSLALVIEYAGPFLFFRVPGLGHSSAQDWDISGSHMAERCALFVIIALGEAVLVTGSTYAGLHHDLGTSSAFVASFIASAAMWWIYFDTGAARASAVMAETDQAGLLARNAYTYWHMPIIAAIVVTAVGDALALAKPHDLASRTSAAVIIGGPWLFLIGNQMFKWMTADRRLPPFSHFIGQLLLLLTAVAAWWWGGCDRLTLNIAASATLVATATWEWFSLHGGWRRWLAPVLPPSMRRAAP